MNYKCFLKRLNAIHDKANSPNDMIISFEVKENNNWKIVNTYAYVNDTGDIIIFEPIAGYEDYALLGVYDVDDLVELANDFVTKIPFAGRELVCGYVCDMKKTRAWEE